MDGIRRGSRGRSRRVSLADVPEPRTSSFYFRPPFFLVASLPSTLTLRPAFRHASKSPHPLSLKKENVCTERKFAQRQSRGSSRPAPRPAANPPPQSRGAHTAATPYPSHTANPTQSPPVPHQTATTQTSNGPGMLAQMAATAGSVAVGSTIGHGLSSMLFGGGGGHSQPVEQSPPVQQQQQTFQQSGISCDVQAKGSFPVLVPCLPRGNAYSFFCASPSS
jgi:hypothetical protein